MGTMAKQGVAVVGLVFCALVAGCGDDDNSSPDAGAGTGGNSGTGGGGGMDAATPAPATRVGNACTEASDCDGPKPACLESIDPGAPFAGIAELLGGFLGGGMGGGLPDASIEAPGGYCTSEDCTNDMQCGDNASCLSVTALLDAFTAQMGGGAGGGLDIGGLLGSFLPSTGGFCLLACADDSDCTRDGYACRPLIDTAAFTGPDGGFAFPADAGFALPDGGFSLPDGGIGLPDGGIAFPTYCLPAVPNDNDAGDDNDAGNSAPL